ncbi:hypothetical protein DE146DRAFT_773172 [Phaeosphaeria sp. MPI-PUGE-AT-0046c]|nr:hypothetical protein DE146DRAFT_773172 [Phaeosphaeria sp. MPI-PUGE-AT-0046c]
MDIVTAALLKGLAKSSYACGGIIKVQPPQSAQVTPAGHFQALDPVTIRWDTATSIDKLVLPKSSAEADKGISAVANLVAGTQPASFGYQGKDIVDELYRKASKLDSSAFSTNFCPYKSGIVDVIGVLAELYKLNIYQAPSGFFKPHVDTPRSELQFGSLVVCLPCEHEGGQLIVRHQGHTTTFDWSDEPNDIKWAAFYSDCEHEVLEVTSGHRITLTYNLYMRRGLGEMAGHCGTLDARQLPVYKDVRKALATANFMPDGGLLGKYCSHAYAHATKAAASALPSVLKGSDMVAFEVFRALGIKVFVNPVADHISKHIDEDNTDSEEEEDRVTHYHIGESFTEPYSTDCELGQYDTIHDVYNAYTNVHREVTWVNQPVDENKSMQFLFMRYGNQSETDFEYSYCALLFEIPPFSKRLKLAQKYGYAFE